MKRFYFLAAVMLASLMLSQTADAGVRIGPRAGVALNRMHFNSDVFDSDNRAGITAGLQAEVMFGCVGFDASAMYVRRNQQAFRENAPYINTAKDYIDVPVNLKLRLGLPLIGDIVSPYLATGPDFAFLTSRRAINDAWSNRAVDVMWNFGVGLELVKRLQVSVTYGMGMTKLSRDMGFTSEPYDSKALSGCNNQWMVTAAWMF